MMLLQIGEARKAKTERPEFSMYRQVRVRLLSPPYYSLRPALRPAPLFNDASLACFIFYFLFFLFSIIYVSFLYGSFM